VERRGLTVTRERVNEIVGAFLGVDESGAAAGVGAVPAGQGAVLAQYWRSVAACHSGSAGAGKACCESLELLHIIWINPCSAGDQIRCLLLST
jgi:hypothetical protein